DKSRPWEIMEVIEQYADLVRAEQLKERALEVFSMILHNPATVKVISDAVEVKRAALEAELSPEACASAWERGKALSIENITADILEDPVTRSTHRNSQDDLPDLELTERELEILRLIAEGESNQDIAAHLSLALSTVKWYVSEIFSKLHA